MKAEQSAKRVHVKNLRPTPPVEAMSGIPFKKFQNVDAWIASIAAWREGRLLSAERNANGLWDVCFPSTVSRRSKKHEALSLLCSAFSAVLVLTPFLDLAGKWGQSISVSNDPPVSGVEQRGMVPKRQ